MKTLNPSHLHATIDVINSGANFNLLSMIVKSGINSLPEKFI